MMGTWSRNEGSESRPVATPPWGNHAGPPKDSCNEGSESRPVAAVVEGMGGCDHTPARIGGGVRRRTFVAA